MYGKPAQRICAFLICVLAPLAVAESNKRLSDIVELHRKIIFLVSDSSSNVVSRERDVFIARNFYVEKQALLEELESRVLDNTDQGRAVVAELMSFIESDESRAADALAFIDLVDAILFQQNQNPFLSSGQISYLYNLQQQIALIQESYSKDLEKISGALVTRGIDLEPWDDYIKLLRSQYTRESIYQSFNQSGSELAEPVMRGAEAQEDKPELVWGFNVPDKTVVLTFDDGPHYRNTEAILDTLKAHEINAYFFAVGKNIGTLSNGEPTLGKNAGLLKRALLEGHHLANHSYSHSVLTKLDADGQKTELHNTNQLLKAVSGNENTFFRPPYGSKNPALLELSSSLSMRTIMWNIDSQDWADPVPESIVKRVMAELEKRKKGIILFHDIHKQTVQALPSLLEELKENDYNIVTIDGSDFQVNTSEINESISLDAPQTSALYENSWAVVVGINQYQYWPQLSYAVNDAKGVSEVLHKEYGFAKERIFTLYDEEATRENIVRVLTETLADPNEVKPGDRVFMFYAGHGMTRTLPSGRNLGYIIPVDAKLDTFSTNSISMTHLQDFSDMIPAKHVYFVMDSCYSGIALTRGAGMATDSKYLSEISGRRARQILTAGGADQEVADGGPQGHSIFTWNLLQGLDGAADLDNNQIITATELGAYVAPKVSNASSQTPVFGNLVGSEGGDFLFELAPIQSSNGNLSETDELRNRVAQLQKENVVLKQKLASLQTETVDSEYQIRGQNDIVNTMSPAQRRSKANELHEEALKFYKQKKYREALPKLRLALTFNPSNITMVNDYGFILYRDGQFKNALAWLEKTIEMDADRIPVYLNIADTLVELDRKKDAVAYYDFYLDRYPDSPVKERINQFLNEYREL